MDNDVKKEYEAQKHHARIMNVRNVVPSLTGQHYKVAADKKHEVAKKMKKQKVITDNRGLEHTADKYYQSK